MWIREPWYFERVFVLDNNCWYGYKYNIQLDTNPKLTLAQNLTLSTGHHSLNVFDLLAPLSHHVIFFYILIYLCTMEFIKVPGF